MVMRPGWRVGGVALRGLGCLVALWCGSIGTGNARGQSPAPTVALDQLLRMSPAELDALYHQGTAVAIPPGRVRGTALLAPGTRRNRPLARGTRLIWQGKIIDEGQTTAVNRFFGIRMIRGQLYQGPSWFDGAPTLVLDYSETSRIYARNRDEIRQVAPGVFLGLMYDRTTTPPRLSMYFALETSE
jgi:hypothetical protein